MTIYYVRTTGNDTTGNGSTGTPWLTLVKAFTIVAAGDTILVGDGTYAEDNGAGIWQLNKTYASYVTVAPENGATGAVIIQGASGVTYNLLIQAAAYIKFQYITFNQRIATNNYAIRMNSITTGINHIYFDHCTFTTHPDAITYSYGVLIDAADGKTSDSITFDTCTWTADASDSRHQGLTVTPATTTGTCTNLSVLNCNFWKTGFGGFYALNLNGCTGAVVTGGNFAAYGSCPIICGTDAASGGKTTTVTLTGVRVTNTNSAIAGHGILMGNGCVSCVVDGAVVDPYYDYGLVIKENTGTEVKNCILNGKLYSALYCKAAISPNIHDNYLFSTAGTTNGVAKFGKGDVNKFQNITFLRNRVTAIGNANLIYWGDSSEDLGGGVSDYNVYNLTGSGNYGQIISTTGIASLAALRAAWSGYGDGSNDSHSQMAVPNELFIMLFRH